MKINIKQNKGFTLIELLVVVGIISLLSSVVLAGVQSAREKAQNAKTVAGISELKKALEFYKTDTREYPSENNPAAYEGLGLYGFGDAVDYLSSVLKPKYISTVFRFGKPNSTVTSWYGYDGNVSLYITGNDRYLYYDYPGESDKFSITCGNRILKSYVYYFYDDQTLNLPNVGYAKSENGGATWTFYPNEPGLIGEPSTNWYCIGE